jgi:ribulose-phosphate 3-epimerase
MPLIAPSIVAADWARLGEALEVMTSAGTSMVHVDVMDGHFVPEISVGLPVVASLRKATKLAMEVHLLIERPERYVGDFISAGADWVSFHPETTPHGRRVLEGIRSRGAKAGLAISLSTPFEAISEFWPEIDFLSILTAEPGVQESAFVASSVDRVRAASRSREERRLNFALQAEGGIGPNRIEEIARAGADILVMGSAIFHSEDPQTRLRECVHTAAQVRRTTVV